MSKEIIGNLSIADKIKRKSDAIVSAQIEECVRQLSHKGEPLTAAEAAAEFVSNFGNYLNTVLFYNFCTRVTKSGLAEVFSANRRIDDCTVACISNANTAAALQKLCKNVSFTEKALSDLRSCCEEVSSGHTDYCVLPIESTDDGIFTSFRKLVRAHELKICEECTVSCSDREAEMRFALLGRTIEKNTGAEYITFSFLPEGNEISEILYTLESVGCKITAVNTYPAEFSIDKCECTVSVNCKITGIEPVVYFLEGALPGHIILGVY